METHKEYLFYHLGGSSFCASQIGSSFFKKKCETRFISKEAPYFDCVVLLKFGFLKVLYWKLEKDYDVEDSRVL